MLKSICSVIGVTLGGLACLLIDTKAVRMGVVTPWQAAFWETAYIFVAAGWMEFRRK